MVVARATRGYALETAGEDPFQVQTGSSGHASCGEFFTRHGPSLRVAAIATPATTCWKPFLFRLPGIARVKTNVVLKEIESRFFIPV